jgi:hypothetical protein
LILTAICYASDKRSESEDKDHWFAAPAGGKTVSKWRVEIQADFARRADWMLP